jgi:3-methyladenine DNA glycosylase AlkC
MEPLKNLLSPEVVTRIGRAMSRADRSFNMRVFLRNIANELEPLELKQRMMLITSRLQLVLPEDPRKSFPRLIAALKQDENDKIGLSGFSVWPLTRYVAEHGLRHFELSMESLHAMTQVFTAEFDIRPFLIHQEERTLKQLVRWTEDPSEHVRRLVSEGSRPLLPWGERLPQFVKYPERTWPLLEALKDDPSLYVRKSVANHINDHSKHHGDWVVKQLKSWRQPKSANPSHREWIIRHATRTLVKRGHPGALKLHGIAPSSAVTVVRAKILTPRIKLGESLRVQVVLQNSSTKPVPTIVDHELRLLKSNGTHAAKVFKGKKFVLEVGETRTIELQIPIRRVTVRAYYQGRQYWAPLINGKVHTAHQFVLNVAD